MAATAQEVQDLAREQQVEFINLQFTDIVGMVKTVTIPIDQLADCFAHGVWFDGSSIEGFARVAESDMYLVPDLATYALIPWDVGQGITTARLICDVYTPDGKPFPGDPRHVLRRVMAEAEALGYEYNTGPEFEFFLFRPGPDGRPRPVPHDDAGYFDVPTDMAVHVRRQMVTALQVFGIKVEASHHEVAAGQHEIDFTYDNALKAADNAVTFRVTLKAIAQRNGLYATFMPKPLTGINGNGMHVHQSLVSLETRRNVFYDGDDAYGISDTARRFIAGLLAHAPGMTAVLAPLVNSYKRLVPGYEAPVYVSWGRTNRSALVRVPRITRGRTEATRVELRCPDPACNPYLAFAVMLKAGLDGLARRLPLPEPAEEDLFQVDPRQRNLDMIPSSLGDALTELGRDDVIRAALGPHVYERFVEAKTQEWQEYQRYVTQWELDRYLPIY